MSEVYDRSHVLERLSSLSAEVRVKDRKVSWTFENRSTTRWFSSCAAADDFADSLLEKLNNEGYAEKTGSAVVDDARSWVPPGCVDAVNIRLVTTSQCKPPLVPFVLEEEDISGLYGSVLLIEGNLHITKDFNASEWTRLDDLGWNAEEGLIVVSGCLRVDGRVNFGSYSPGLLVTGTTDAHTVEGGDGWIFLQGHTRVSYFVVGFHHGHIRAPKLDVPFIISQRGHPLSIESSGAMTIADGAGCPEYDLQQADFAEKLVPEIFLEGSLDLDSVYEQLAAGASLLKDE